MLVLLAVSVVEFIMSSECSTNTKKLHFMLAVTFAVTYCISRETYEYSYSIFMLLSRYNSQ